MLQNFWLRRFCQERSQLQTLRSRQFNRPSNAAAKIECLERRWMLTASNITAVLSNGNSTLTISEDSAGDNDVTITLQADNHYHILGKNGTLINNIPAVGGVSDFDAGTAVISIDSNTGDGSDKVTLDSTAQDFAAALTTSLSGGAGNHQYVFVNTNRLGSVSVTNPTGPSTIDLSQSTKDVWLKLGISTVQDVNGDGGLLLTLNNGTADQTVKGGAGNNYLRSAPIGSSTLDGSLSTKVNLFQFVDPSSTMNDIITPSPLGTAINVLDFSLTMTSDIDVDLSFPNALTTHLAEATSGVNVRTIRTSVASEVRYVQKVVGGRGLNEFLGGNTASHVLVLDGSLSTVGNRFAFFAPNQFQSDIITPSLVKGVVNTLDFSGHNSFFPGVTVDLSKDGSTFVSPLAMTRPDDPGEEPLTIATGPGVGYAGSYGLNAYFTHVIGSSRDDLLIAGPRDTRLEGLRGSDTFVSGLGNDVLIPGRFSDGTFQFLPQPAGNVDTIVFQTFSSGAMDFSRISSDLVVDLTRSDTNVASYAGVNIVTDAPQNGTKFEKVIGGTGNNDFTVCNSFPPTIYVDGSLSTKSNMFRIEDPLQTETVIITPAVAPGTTNTLDFSTWSYGVTVDLSKEGGQATTDRPKPTPVASTIRETGRPGILTVYTGAGVGYAGEAGLYNLFNTVIGGTKNDVIIGNPGYTSTTAPLTLHGGGGNDTITGSPGNVITGDGGSNTIYVVGDGLDSPPGNKGTTFIYGDDSGNTHTSQTVTKNSISLTGNFGTDDVFINAGSLHFDPNGNNPNPVSQGSVFQFISVTNASIGGNLTVVGAADNRNANDDLYLFNAVIGSLTANLGAGNDLFLMQPSLITGDTNIDLGDGDNNGYIAGLPSANSIEGNLTLTAGDGKNVLSFTNSLFKKSAIITVGNGDNSVSVSTSALKDLILTAGLGANVVMLNADNISSSLHLTAGSTQSSVYVSGSLLPSDVTVTGFGTRVGV